MVSLGCGKSQIISDDFSAPEIERMEWMDIIQALCVRGLYWSKSKALKRILPPVSKKSSRFAAQFGAMPIYIYIYIYMFI